MTIVYGGPIVKSKLKQLTENKGVTVIHDNGFIIFSLIKNGAKLFRSIDGGITKYQPMNRKGYRLFGSRKFCKAALREGLTLDGFDIY